MDIFSIGLQNMMRLLSVVAGDCLLVIIRMSNWLNIIEFTKNLKLGSSFLLHLGIDGPNVNNAFQQKLFDELHEKAGSSFLNLGICCLNKVHNAYQTALKELKFDVDQFAVDIHSFFKLKCKTRRLHEHGRGLIGININLINKNPVILVAAIFSLWNSMFAPVKTLLSKKKLYT